MVTLQHDLRAGLIIGAATMTMALGFGALALTSVFIRPLEAEFGWSRGEISMAYTLASAGMALGGVVWGRLMVRINLRVLLLLGSASMVAALAVLALTQSLWQLYVANFALGAFGFSALNAPMLAVVGQWFDKRRGLAMGIVTAGGAIGQGVMPWSADLLVGGMGWRTAFALLAIFSLLAFLVALPAVKRPDTTSFGSAAATAPEPMPGHSQVYLLSLAAFFCCACMGVPLVHLTSFVTAICGSPGIGSTSLLIAMLFGAIGRVAFGLVADCIGNLTAYALASLTQTVCIVVYPAISEQATILALSAIFGFGFAGNMTCLILCVRETAGERWFGQALGVVMLVAWIGMGTGGYVGGLVFDHTGSYTQSFHLAFLAGVANLVVIALVGWTGLRRKRAWANISPAGAMLTSA